MSNDSKVVNNEKGDATPSLEVKSGNYKIAIIVTGLGLNQLSTELALSLPKEVSLGFTPYTTVLKPFIHKAHEEGHEIFMYLPFETAKFPDDSPGPMPLLLNSSDEENLKRMKSLLAAFDGYDGIYAGVNEVFTNSHKVTSILSELVGQKRYLLTTHNIQLPGEMSNVMVSSDIIIDSEPNMPEIKKQLDLLIELAKSGKKAIGYANNYPVTIYALKAWIPMLHDMGISIVPVSDMFNGRKK